MENNNIDSNIDSNIDTESIFDDLDDNWLIEFQNNDKQNNDFVYSNTLDTPQISNSSDNGFEINVYSMYIDGDELNFIDYDTIRMTNNYVPRKTLLEFIKKKSVNNNNNYLLYFLLKYNTDIKYDNIEDLLNHTIDFEKNNIIENMNEFKYFEIYKNISDLYFNCEIQFLKQLSSLYLIFYKKIEKQNINYTPSLKIPYYENKDKRSTKNNRFNRYKKYKLHREKLDENKDKNKDENKDIKNISNSTRKLKII
tara:strand:+ start:5300 stop:6058 length:759 start_codon:yes stop_codon:yes gene_type:complete